jgi:hypothetical protein
MKTVNDLRDVLFDTMEKLKNGEIHIDQAKAISELGQTIINSAKVEVEYAKATGEQTSEFMAPDRSLDALPPGITSITRHKLKG